MENRFTDRGDAESLLDGPVFQPQKDPAMFRSTLTAFAMSARRNDIRLDRFWADRLQYVDETREGIDLER